MPSQQHSSAIECSPRKPSSTMRIFSSAEITWSKEVVTVLVAVFGTTISPYMFFWQSAEEVEDETLAGDGSLLDHPEDAPAELDRIAWDTYIGMGFSSLISFFIVLTTAVTLHTAGITDIATSADAAQALRPIAGEFAFLLFSLGIIGTGLLALPVLAGSAAYADRRIARLADRARAEAGERQSLLWRHRPGVRARAPDAVPADRPDQGAVLERGSQRRDRRAADGGHDDRRIEPQASWAASSRRSGLKIMGWPATAVMAAAALAMFVF